MIENLSIVFLLMAGAGIKAVAIAKLLAALAWVVVFYRLPVTHYPLALHVPQLLLLLHYSGSVLGSELMRCLRSQLDMVIAGRLLSPELLGIYSFAKSAGVGLSQSLSSAWLGVLYPYICKQRRQLSCDFTTRRIWLLSAGIGGIFVAQALVAPLYIQYLFAPRWHGSTALVSLLCLTAIPALLVETESCLLRARAQLGREFLLMCFGVGLMGFCLLLIVPSTPLGLAVCLLVASLLWLCSFAHRFFTPTFHPFVKVIL